MQTWIKKGKGDKWLLHVTVLWCSSGGMCHGPRDDTVSLGMRGKSLRSWCPFHCVP